MALSASKVSRAQSYHRRQGQPDTVGFVRTVESLQALSNALAGTRLTVDGAFGSKTRTAMNAALRRPHTDPVYNAAQGVKYALDRLSSATPDPDARAAARADTAPIAATTITCRSEAGSTTRHRTGETASKHNVIAAEEYRMKVSAPYAGPGDRRLANDIWSLQWAEDLDTHAAGMITPRVAARLKEIAGKPAGGNPTGMRLSQGLKFALPKMLLIGGGLLALGGIAFLARKSMGFGAGAPASAQLVELSADEYAEIAQESATSGMVPAPRANPYFSQSAFAVTPRQHR